MAAPEKPKKPLQAALARRAPDALSSPSARCAICLDCRTAYREGESCDAGLKHRVARLDDEHGLERVRSEVWGPSSVRRRAWRLLKASSGGVTLGSLLETCAHSGGCEAGASAEGLLIGIFVVVVISAVVVAIGWGVMKLVEYIRVRRNTPKPHGALDRPARIPRLGGVPGVVEAESLVRAPASGEQCVAWAMELRTKRYLGSGVMLRDAGCGEFRVRLADGAAIRIAAGRIRLRGRASRVREPSDTLREHLKVLEPLRGEEEDFDAIPYDEVREARLNVGDRVLVFGHLERVEAVQQASGSYREAAPAELQPRGIPVLRVR